MEKILIVEDDKLINDGIAFALSKKDYKVYQAQSEKEALYYLNSNPDLILLDISLDDMDGITLCKKIKSSLEIPIIFITAKDSEEDIIKGFDAGSEDYIVKPFSIPIMIRRIEVVLKRIKKQNKDIYFIGNLMYDLKNYELKKDNIGVCLTATESKILSLFIKNKNQVLTRESIIGQIWDINENFVDEKALNVNIRRLRKKIEKNPSNPEYIKTVFGIGYKWNESI